MGATVITPSLNDLYPYTVSDVEAAADLKPQTLKTWHARNHYLISDNQGWESQFGLFGEGWRRYSDVDIARVGIMAELISQSLPAATAFGIVQQVTPQLAGYMRAEGFLDVDHAEEPKHGTPAVLVAAFERNADKKSSHAFIFTTGDRALDRAFKEANARFSENGPTSLIVVIVDVVLYRVRKRLHQWMMNKKEK